MEVYLFPDKQVEVNSMNIELMTIFTEYMEKQEVLSKLTEAEKLHGYHYSEIHTIVAIKELKEPNVTEIAKRLKLSKGAITKITQRLMKYNLIESYMQPENKQKVFFKLTDCGQELYDEHDKRHKLWLKRDDAFLKQYENDKLEGIKEFMIQFNKYLDYRLKN